MKKPNKTAALILAIMLIVTLIAACGKKEEETPAATSEAAATASVTEAIKEAVDSAAPVGDEIKIGLLSAASGGTAVLDTYITNAAQMAVNEINSAGGVNGKQIKLYIEDYASDPSMAAEKAEKLIVNDGVIAIIGVVMSSCRQAVLPVVEKYDNLLIYPTDYEGLEQSDNIIYIGCVPNQQIQTIAPWIPENLGGKVYIIGSDYLYPRSTCAQAKALLIENGAEIVGEEYVSLDETDYTASITKIIQAKPDVVFSVLVGDCITAFQKQWALYSVTGINMFHLCLDESGVAAIGTDSCEGVYSGQTYFNTVDSEQNNVFKEKYISLYKDEPTVYASSGYVGAYLLYGALSQLEDSFTTTDLVNAFHGQTFDGPAGFVTIKDNNHSTITARIGVVNSEGRFDVLYQTDDPIDPDPFAGEKYYSEG